MNYEKKYKEALEWARKVMEGKVGFVLDEVLEKFPELRESKDEQHRKWILEYLYDGLRKSDEQFKDQFKSAIAWLEKQGEQKPVDEAEPKFHEGDWTVSDLDGKVRQISEVHSDEYNSYYVVDGKSVNLKEYDRLHHLWTIQDAKDGDVLYHKAENGIEYIVMSKGLNEFNNIDSYFRYRSIDGFDIDVPSVLSAEQDNIHPATKEQCDTLMKAMTDAGYTFDLEKKELKKIEQNPAWSEDDEEMLNSIIEDFGDGKTS